MAAKAPTHAFTMQLSMIDYTVTLRTLPIMHSNQVNGRMGLYWARTTVSDGGTAAAVFDIGHGATWLAGLATFLAIFLHKPFDAGIISTLMLGSGIPRNARLTLNFLYALAVPMGSFAFVFGINFFGASQSSLTGASLALAAGAFLCIAAADLLPEVQFHSHDRILLTVALAIGIALAWALTVLEQTSHPHRQIMDGITENFP